MLKSAVQQASLGRDEEMQALKRLDNQARLLERTATGPSFDAFVAQQRNESPALGGRSVFGWEADLVEKGMARSAGQARGAGPKPRFNDMESGSGQTEELDSSKTRSQ